MSKHTPGPWIVTGFDKEFKDQINIQDDERGYYVAAAISCQAQEANARLIAAAPELLEALKNFVDGCSVSVDAFAVARAAIAKATGA